MTQHLRDVWVVEPVDLLDIAEHMGNVVDAAAKDAYLRGIANSNGKGKEKVAEAVQKYDGLAFLQRWFPR